MKVETLMAGTSEVVVELEVAVVVVSMLVRVDRWVVVLVVDEEGDVPLDDETELPLVEVEVEALLDDETELPLLVEVAEVLLTEEIPWIGSTDMMTVTVTVDAGGHMAERVALLGSMLPLKSVTVMAELGGVRFAK